MTEEIDKQIEDLKATEGKKVNELKEEISIKQQAYQAVFNAYNDKLVKLRTKREAIIDAAKMMKGKDQFRDAIQLQINKSTSLNHVVDLITGWIHNYANNGLSNYDKKRMELYLTSKKKTIQEKMEWLNTEIFKDNKLEI
jgi:hypothetical protein